MKFIYKKYGTNTLGGILISFVLGLVIVLILTSFYFFYYLPSATNHGESITVPDLMGRNVQELNEVLKDLRYEVNDSSYSADYPPLAVLKQFPRAGAKVKEGRKIDISINRLDPPTVPVPNLIDGSIVNADAVLKSNELKRGHIELVSGPFNVVKEMKIKGAKVVPGVRVPKGSVIDLVVMDGGKVNFEMGELVGMEYEDAKVYLLGVSLNIGKVTGDTVGIVPVVLKQKPDAGEKIMVGDIVDLWIGAAGTEAPEDEETEDK